jgi:uncharacterized protein YndB with AHSA1/START domain
VTHTPETGDDAVLKATGRSWSEWFDVLGGAEMAQRTHQEIVAFLREEHGVPSWWQQHITNEFEQSIGRRSKYEADDGFQVSVTRTLDFPVATVFAAWIDEEQRARWLRRGDFEPTTVREPGTVRGKWLPDGSRVDVEMSDEGEGRCKLTIGHRKLAREESVGTMRQFWKQSIDRLVERIAGAK